MEGKGLKLLNISFRVEPRNTKLEDGLLEVQDVLQPIDKPNENVFQKTDGNADEEISEEMKEKVSILMTKFIS